ncbi:MAG: class I SAM-dependent methyltransferase [Bacteroidota bacterium]
MMNLKEIFVRLEQIIDEYSENEAKMWSKNILLNNKKRYLNDLKIINRYNEKEEILEIGSAPYHLTYMLSEMNYKVIGLDLDPSRFSKLIDKMDLNIIKCDIEKTSIPFENNRFKFIIFNEIFEHLRIDPISTLKEINRVLHPEGYLLLTTPNLYSIQCILFFILGKGFDNPYKQFKKLHEIGHMGHTRLYSTRQLNEFLRNTGFEVIKVSRKSFKSLPGILAPLNIIRWIFPRSHSYIISISKKKLVQ